VRAAGGTYALVFACHETAAVEVGRFGTVRLLSGFYTYVGSAFGPGGVKARVERHWRDEKRRHWHIDYLTRMLVPQCAWFSYGPTRVEHSWAEAFAAMSDFVPIPRVGASDCRCASHLFFSDTAPRAHLFERVGGSGIRYRVAPA
jgi:Uri superfamily endonuclease